MRKSKSLCFLMIGQTKRYVLISTVLLKCNNAGKEDPEESKTPGSLGEPKHKSGAEDEILTSCKGQVTKSETLSTKSRS